MNTIIINKILMHMLDFEHRKIFHSASFVDLNETSIDYYRKEDLPEEMGDIGEILKKIEE